MKTFYYDTMDPRSFETIARTVKAASLKEAEAITGHKCRELVKTGVVSQGATVQYPGWQDIRGYNV